MELPTNFVDLLDEYFKSQNKEDLFRLGTIDPTYNGTGFPKVKFDGDDAVADKGYSFLDSYDPVAGDKVLLQLIGNAYIIIGKINNPQNSTGGYTPPSGGGGGSTAWGDITGKPLTFNPSSHSHSWSEITSKPTEFTPSAHSHDWAEITGKPSTFTPATHSHAWADITGKPTTFTPSAHTHLWADITDKPTTFTPATHSHATSDVTGLDTALAGKASTSHTHADATTGASGFMTAAFVTKLNGIATGANLYVHPTGDGNLHVPATSTTNNLKVLKAGATAGTIAWGNVAWSELTGVPSTFTPSAHTHVIADITNFPSQTGNSGKVLTTDGTNLSWVTPSGGGGAVAWADITGKPTTFAPSAHTHATSEVTGLDTALAGKASTAVATTGANGLMSSTDKTKLDGVAASANNYVHPTTDGNKHVPANGTTNNGKFLEATGTAGTYAWVNITISDVTSLQTTLDGKVDETRTSVTLVSPTDYSNGWVEFTGRPVKITKALGGEMVQITGAVRTGTLDATVFTIPAGYRPPVKMDFSCPIAGSAGGNARVIVDTDGTVRVFGTTGGVVTFIALDGIMYFV
jgi:hypothetical protein